MRVIIAVRVLVLASSHFVGFRSRLVSMDDYIDNAFRFFEETLAIRGTSDQTCCLAEGCKTRALEGL